MRLFAVIPHYCGPLDSANSSTLSASYLEPLSRIAALNETIVSLHRNFGPYRAKVDGARLPAGANAVDITIVTMREHNVLPQLGIDPDLYAVEHVDGPPTQIPFHAQRLMKARLGQYDFYAVIEHDIAIHDPAFFDKLGWFQRNFGPTALLAPTRVETAATGMPSKVIVDPALTLDQLEPFRRAGQRATLQASWHGREIGFALPDNPHASGYFLTAGQLAHWVAQPSFDDRDASWMGPVESGVTLGIGKVFDIYKAVAPDPFFLEVHHYGASFAARCPPPGRRQGDPPLLAIAQGALRLAARENADVSEAGALWPRIARWVDEPTVGERAGIAMQLEAERRELQLRVDELAAHAQRQRDQIAEIEAHAQRQADHIGSVTTHNRQLGAAHDFLTERTRQQAGEIAALTARTQQQDAALAAHVAERDRLSAERDRLSAERDRLSAERDRLSAERDRLRDEFRRQAHSLRWLAASITRELSRRMIPPRRIAQAADGQASAAAPHRQEEALP